MLADKLVWNERLSLLFTLHRHMFSHAVDSWCSWWWLEFQSSSLVNEWSQSRLYFSTLTITRHPLSPLQSTQSLLKDGARLSMSATLNYVCRREGCVVMTPARLYQFLAKEWVTGWVTPKTVPTLPHLRGSPCQTCCRWSVGMNMKHHMRLDRGSFVDSVWVFTFLSYLKVYSNRWVLTFLQLCKLAGTSFRLMLFDPGLIYE